MECMRKVYFLLNHKSHLLDLAGPCQALHEAHIRGAKIEIEYISFDATIETAQKLTLTNLKQPPTELEDHSILIVAASLYEDSIFSDSASLKSIQWLKQLDVRHILVIGVCTGSFLLAKAGLLDHKKCTTHHSLTQVLQENFPQVQVVPDQIFVQDKQIFTTAGVTAGIDLILYLLENEYGIDFSLAVARDLVVYRRRMANDSQFSVHLKYRHHISPLIHQVQDYILKHYKQPIQQQDLAENYHISLRHLQRSFKTFTGITIHKYINMLRFEEAKALMKNSYKIEYAAFLAGFPNSNALRKQLEQEKY